MFRLRCATAKAAVPPEKYEIPKPEIPKPGTEPGPVVDAMERDMGTTLATKTDLLLIRQEIALVQQRMASRTDALRQVRLRQGRRGRVKADCRQARMPDGAIAPLTCRRLT